jgi:parallel beta-helix repeat protein
VSIGIGEGETKKRKGARMRQVGFLLAIGVIATTSVATAKIWRVPNKCPTIQAGINAAVDGDTVLVADGTYTGDGNRDIDFKGKAILVTSKNGPEVTVIDCEGSYEDPHRGFYFHSGEDLSSVVRGFTITNGYAFSGGGIYCYLSSPTIKGNTITGNTSDYGGGISCYYRSSPIIAGNTITDNTTHEGGGIYCHYYSSPTIEGNTITGNTAGLAGGIYSFGYFSPTIEGNTIAGNTADYGGGIYCYESSPTIKGNTITGNTAYYKGGGICCWDSSPTIESNKITGNIAYIHSGGIYCYESSPTIKGNTITGNTADHYGGGIYCHYYSSPTIEGNTITGNSAHWYGGGIYCHYYSSPTIEGNTITGNSAHWYGGGIYCYDSSSPTVLNSILWADSAGVGQEIYVDETSSIDITYSDIQGGWEGEGNIDADPLFVLSEHRDYRLLWGSPCIDSGHPDSLDPDGTRSDMGAYPFDRSTPLTIYLTPDTTTVRLHGELGVTYTVINIESDSLTFSLQSDVYLPNGKPYSGNPIVGPIEATLAENETKQRHIAHQVPGSALLGTYTYMSTLSFSANQLVDEDSFTFQVYPMGTVRHVPSEYSTIQAGIDAAYDGDTVLVAPGIYTGVGNRDMDFKGKQIVVMSENGPEVTIIDCEGDSLDPHRGFYFHRREGSSSVVQGFTITNGYASGDWPQICGGAILCDSTSSPTIKGNTITGNTADDDGGGIYCYSSSLIIDGNTITGNTASDGGGIYCYYYSSPTIGGNTITGNTADDGGGIYCYYYSSPTIEGNTISGNTADGNGGGIYCDNFSSPTIDGNTITGNTAVYWAGGGIYCDYYSSPTIGGNTITGNTADLRGGGIYCSWYSSPTVLNSILWADSAGTGQEIYVDGTSSIDVSYSDIEGGWEGEGNIDADPLFVTGPLGDYYLSQPPCQPELSPCVDAGHLGSVPEGTTRTDHVDDTWPVDMGYHYTIDSAPDVSVTPLPMPR